MAKHTFTKKERLLRREDFTRVFTEGKRFFTKNFSVQVLRNSLGRTRLGVSASTRFGPAVKRNRARRFLREFFRTHKEVIFPGETVDVVLSPRKGAEVRDYKAVEEELARFFLKTKKVPS